jgi:hypothetical protein
MTFVLSLHLHFQLVIMISLFFLFDDAYVDKFIFYKFLKMSKLY